MTQEFAALWRKAVLDRDADCLAAVCWCPKPIYRPDVKLSAQQFAARYYAPADTARFGLFPKATALPPVTMLKMGPHDFEEIPGTDLVVGDKFSIPGTPGTWEVKLHIRHYVASTQGRVFNDYDLPKVLREKRKPVVTLIQATEQAITGQIINLDAYRLRPFATGEEFRAAARAIFDAQARGELTAAQANDAFDGIIYRRMLEEMELEANATLERCD